MVANRFMALAFVVLAAGSVSAETLDCQLTEPGATFARGRAYRVENVVELDWQSDANISLSSGSHNSGEVDSEMNVHYLESMWLAESTCDAEFGTATLLPQHNAAIELYCKALCVVPDGERTGKTFGETISEGEYEIQPSAINPLLNDCVVTATISLVSSFAATGHTWPQDTEVYARVGNVSVHGILDYDEWNFQVTAVGEEGPLQGTFNVPALNFVLVAELPSSVGSIVPVQTLSKGALLSNENSHGLMGVSAHAAFQADLLPGDVTPISQPSLMRIPRLPNGELDVANAVPIPLSPGGG